MAFALEFADAVDIWAAASVPGVTRDEISMLIVVEYVETCRNIERRLDFLARHAGGKCPV